MAYINISHSNTALVPGEGKERSCHRKTSAAVWSADCQWCLHTRLSFDTFVLSHVISETAPGGTHLSFCVWLIWWCFCIRKKKEDHPSDASLQLLCVCIDSSSFFSDLPMLWQFGSTAWSRSRWTFGAFRRFIFQKSLRRSSLLTASLSALALKANRGLSLSFFFPPLNATANIWTTYNVHEIRRVVHALCPC